MFLCFLSMKAAALSSMPGSATHRPLSSTLCHTLPTLVYESSTTRADMANLSPPLRGLLDLNKLKNEEEEEGVFCLLLAPITLFRHRDIKQRLKEILRWRKFKGYSLWFVVAIRELLCIYSRVENLGGFRKPRK